MSLSVRKWSRLLEVIPGRFKQGTFEFIWLDLFQFSPHNTTLSNLYPPFTYFFFQLLSASISATNIRPLVEAEFDPGQD